ncbi:PREDICTED: uncharacterized protein LOC104813941 [Tarenaya hassleriana]|uniref:uncharacterized protein LOC104813941 n=1 Tax=Tarenaya hassleriana TaxID=28532 RepID=UPI00053CA5FE|nr:PREDICTED: uncharacterized protein LOC104813941 [Tarenaya hassleriana]
MATSSFTARGAHTMNTMFSKPMLRKSIHKKSASHDIARETAKADGGGEEMKTAVGSSSSARSWVPHERTGIYYPKGQENVLQDVPPPPRTETDDDAVVNWFS